MDQTDNTQLEKIICDSLLGFHVTKQGTETEVHVEVERILPRAFSTVTFLKVTSPESCCRYVAKTIEYDPRNKRVLEQDNQAAVEFRRLKEFYPSFANENGIAVPKPIMALPEWNTYLMDFVEGETLADLEIASRIGYNRDKIQSLIMYYKLLGRWTAKFHQISGIHFESLKGEDLFPVRAQELFQMLDETHRQRVAVNKFRSHIMKKIEGHLSRLQNRQVPYTTIHSDFGPWNIMAGKGQITVFDFMGSQKGPWPRDVMDMDLHLEHLNYNLFASRSRVQSMRDAFWSGYGPKPECPREWLDLCKTIIYLEGWCSSFLSRKQNLPQKLHRLRWRRHCQKVLLDGSIK